MSIFDIISLLGGLAMFLYGMRLMGDSLKEGSSGTLKLVMGKVTNNPLKAFLLGLLVTAIIQSSTATIVITAGLVAAEIISLHQSLGIIIGANVGTTVTGQIIRLLDVDASATSWLNVFKPSTLAPIALIVGMVLIMGFKFKKSNNIGAIAIGFGILFSGLLNMTNAVNVLSESGMLDNVFSSLGENGWLAYLVGAGVAFVLQSSSATIGILQAFAMASDIPFKTVFIVLVGIYLGDCLTTGIVCSIGAKTNSKRVGLVNILFNLSETVLVLIVVYILHAAGLLDGIWESSMTPGTIANTNTVFNLGCAILLFPMLNVYEKLSIKIIREKSSKPGKYADQINALNPVFFSTPALAFNAAFDILKIMLRTSMNSVAMALDLTKKFDNKVLDEIMKEEDEIDNLTDYTGNYLAQLSPHVSEEKHMLILNQYTRLVNEFERLGDHAVNIAECAAKMNDENIHFSEHAIKELDITRQLLDQIFEYTREAFEKRNIQAARRIEPLEDVMDDLINTLQDNHLTRLRDEKCSIITGTVFLDVLTNIERISDLCSNVGISVVARVNPQLAALAHNYVSALHAGKDKQFSEDYERAHSLYFTQLDQVTQAEN